MRLLYFVQYFYPEKCSGGDLVLDLLEGYAKHGWNVDVYTPTPTRGVSDAVRKEYKQKGTEKLYGGRVTIHRMPLYREGKGFIVRAVRYIIFSLQCLWKGLREPAEVIFTGSGPPSQGVIVGIIKRLTGKRFVYNLQDIFPDSMIAAGIAEENDFLVKIGRKMERFSYDSADAIITVSEDMKSNILNKGVEADKVIVVPNWIGDDKIKPIPREENALFEALGLTRDAFYVTYAGNLGYMQGLDSVIRAAKYLRNDPQIQLVLFGNGSEEEKIRAMVEEFELSNVTVFPLQSAERLSEVYSLGDVSLVSCRPGTGQAGMPSKTALIMAAGTPVLGYFDMPSEFSRVLKEAEVGWCVPAGEEEQLANTIRKLADNPKKCAVYGQNGAAYVHDKLSRGPAVARYIEVIEKSAAQE